MTTVAKQTEPLVHTLAEFAARVSAAELDPTVATAAARGLRDTLGVALAAIDSEPGRVTRTITEHWGGIGAATVLGGARLPAPSAALVNGSLAHALDFDDTHVPSILHPSASTVPAALAAGQAAGIDGARLLRAVAAGTEIAIRLGNAGYDPVLNNSVFFERGLHATSICGALGSAVAAAIAMDLDAETTAHAMGIAASMGAGLLEANRVGGSVKRIHCGWAAHSGVVAAELARAGITGPATVLEGRFGFLQAYCGDMARPEALVDGLGATWEMLDLFIKPYPTNVFTQTGIDIALRLRAEGVTPEDVVEVELAVPTPVLRTIAEPRAAKIAPASGYHAQFSGAFTFAIALAGGTGLGVYLDDFTDAAVTDARLLALASRIRHVASEECDAIYPYHFPTIARIVTKDGEARYEIRENRGSPARPLSPEELSLKFRLNGARALPVDVVDEIDDKLAGIGDLGSVDELLSPAQLS